MMLEPHSPVALAVDEAHRETKRICHTAADDGNKVVEANVNAVIQAGIATATTTEVPQGTLISQMHATACSPTCSPATGQTTTSPTAPSASCSC